MYFPHDNVLPTFLFLKGGCSLLHYKAPVLSPTPLTQDFFFKKTQTFFNGEGVSCDVSKMVLEAAAGSPPNVNLSLRMSLSSVSLDLGGGARKWF